jgi:hypothetical protein
MADAMWADSGGTLRDNGVPFEPGLTAAEVAAAESRDGFRFPPDLRAFLRVGLPSGGDFPDWRDGDEAARRGWLDLPRRGTLFDIEHNGFWLDEWGRGRTRRCTDRGGHTFGPHDLGGNASCAAGR